MSACKIPEKARVIGDRDGEGPALAAFQFGKPVAVVLLEERTEEGEAQAADALREICLELEVEPNGFRCYMALGELSPMRGAAGGALWNGLLDGASCPCDEAA